MQRNLFITLLTAAVLLIAVFMALSYMERKDSQLAADLKSLAVGEMAELEVFDPPQSIPDIQVYDQNGNGISMADFAGGIVVVNFWATWCAPCIHEMPSLDRLSMAMKRDDLSIITVSLDREGFEAVTPFYQELQLKALSPYHDRAASLSVKVGAVVLPTTIFVDRSGRMVARLAVPAKWDTPDAARVIERILSE